MAFQPGERRRTLMDTTRQFGIIALAILSLAGCGDRAAEENKGAVEETKGAVESTPDAEFEYFCPMHPHIAREQPGACPVCNMPFSKRRAATIQLNLADRRLVETQAKCPVSGEPLGYMGTPVKLTIRDRPVFLCCRGCEEEAVAKPEETLSTVEKLNAPSRAGKPDK